MGLIFQLLLIFAIASYFYLQTSSDQLISQNKSVDQNSEFSGQFMKNISLTEYKINKEGQRDWQLDAVYAHSGSDNSIWYINESQVYLFRDNKKAVTIISEAGQVDTKSKNFVLKNKVVSKTLSGYKFMSVGLTYNSVKESFFSDGEIYIEGPNQSTILKGSSFIGDLNLGKVKIMGPIYCEQIIPEYDKPIIESESASIDINHRHVKFIGKVLILIGDMRITANEAEFKYNKEKGDLDSLIIRGQVFASQKNQSAAADLLEVRVKEGVFLFQGNPRFVSGENTLVGNEILLYNKGKSVQILKGKVKTESELNIIEGN